MITNGMLQLNSFSFENLKIKMNFIFKNFKWAERSSSIKRSFLMILDQ